MGAKLEKCISERARHFVSQYKSNAEYSEEDCNEAIDALSAKWRAEITQEILEERSEEEIAQMKASVDKARKEYSAKKAIEDLRALIIEGIFLAVIVGLLVNQVTDIVTYLKGCKAWGATLIMVVILILILFFYVLTRLASTIGKLLNK